MSIKLPSWIIRTSLFSNVQKIARYEYHSILYFVYKRHAIFHFNDSIIVIGIEFLFTFFYPLCRNRTAAVCVWFCFHLHFHFCTNVTLIELKLDWKYKAGVRQRNKAQMRKKRKIMKIGPPVLQYTIAIMRNISLGHHCTLQPGCNLDCKLDGKRTPNEGKRHQHVWIGQSTEIVSGHVALN